MAEDNVKVAVRVRPFNGREKERNAQCIIKMDGATTSITNPENGDIKNFAFDYSYWSHAPSSNFATQKTVFDDLGIGVLENAWKGYNVSLFAYGQTGAGKSYSMVGYGEDKGIIPCACAELFRRIENNTAPEVTFRVQASMMEIYNERVRDLFNPSNKANEGGGLKVRDNPKTGPYVDGLALLPVKDYSQVDTLMDEGTKARTVASTQMNATSSRAHTIFTLILTQTKVDKAAGKAMDKVSKISLVDLAGSERASGTGATGERLKEGAAINKSLSALGNVISSLAEAAGGGGKKAFVPYRDSVLTWLLKESLGGNAKTIMIAALSPADINYEETLSTLRYADRAKQIKNAAIVNEDPNQKMIRELKEEVERLRLLAAQQSAPAVDLESLTAAARREAEEEAARKFAEYEEELAESKKLLAELNKSWEEKERDAQSIQQQRHLAMVEMGLALSEEDMQLPQLININQDPTRSGAIIYALKQGDTTVGRPDAPTPQTIKLVGLNMSKHHAVITNAHGSLSITSVAGGRTWVNGELLTDLEERQAAAGGGDQGVQLSHNDRLRFGNNHLFRVFDHEAEERRIASRADKGPLPSTPPLPSLPSLLSLSRPRCECF
jgi:kinesin family protein 1